MEDYIQLKTCKFSRYTEMIFVDIKTENGFLFDAIAEKNNIRYRSKGYFEKKDGGGYIIRYLRFRKKLIGKIAEIINKTHNNALLLGYVDLDRRKKELAGMMLEIPRE